MTTSKRFLLSALVAATGTAQAADHGFYLGLAYSDISPDYATPIFHIDSATITAVGDTPSRVTGDAVEAIGSKGLKGVLGYRVYDWLAFEVDYLGLDGDSSPMNLVCVTQPCPDKVEAESSSYSFSALGLWPLGNFDVFARIGVSRWDSRVSLVTSDGWRFWSEDLTGTDEKYGVGGQFHFHQLTTRLEYEHLRFGGDAADTWSLGIAWRF